MRIALVTRSLTRGGAQLQLAILACGMCRRGIGVTVVVLYAGGALQTALEERGVRVECLKKRGRWDMLVPLIRYFSLALRERFDVLYSFLPLENILSLIVARCTGKYVVWGLRGATQDTRQHGYASRLLYGLQRALILAPDGVISNSRAAVLELSHGQSGHFLVVPNGVDTQQFAPDASLRIQVRRELGLADDDTVIGCVARLDSVKDHPNVLRAAALIKSRLPSARFIIVGSGSREYTTTLEKLSAQLGLLSSVIWLGERTDIERLMSALDVYVSASRAEGFPNALAEAMACGVAPAVTGAGDSSMVVGNHGVVVSAGDPEVLAEAVLDCIKQDSATARVLRRQWIVQEYGVERMIDETLKFLSTAARRLGRV